MPFCSVRGNFIYEYVVHYVDYHKLLYLLSLSIHSYFSSRGVHNNRFSLDKALFTGSRYLSVCKTRLGT